MSPYRFLIVLLVSVAAMTGLAAACTWIIDPYGVCRHPSPRQTINQFKTGLGSEARLKAAYALHTLHPAGAILGSSRAGYGIDPGHSFFDDARPTLNLALPGTDIYEIRRLFEDACLRPQFKKALVMLDFFTFNVVRRSRPGRLPDNQSGPLDLLETSRILGFPALLESARTFRASRSGRQLPEQFLCTSAWGGRGHQWVINHGGHAELFAQYRDGFFKDEYEDFALERDGVSSIDDLAAILELAHAREIDLHLAFSPSHASLYHIMHDAGLFPLFQELKRRVCRLNAEIAASHARAPFPLWDFAYINDLTSEPIPTVARDDMLWYWDLSHYKKELGDRLLSTLQSTRPGNFGRILSMETLEEDLGLDAAQVSF